MRNNTMTKQTPKIRGRWLYILLAALIAVMGGVGFAAAKYITEYRKEAEIHGAHFHFSSDHLVYENVTADAVPVTDWSKGITFEVYNYEVENTALKSECDIAYEVEAQGCTVTINGHLTNNQAMAKNDTDGDTIVITPPATAKAGDTVEVTVTSTTPYRKVLKRTFRLSGEQTMTYEVTDMGDYAVVTVYTNGESGTLSVKADRHTLDRQTTSASQNVQAHTTYTLLLLENSEMESSKNNINVTLTKGG